MRVSAFCRKYRISTQAVYKKIKNHEKELNGHITKDKKNVLDLDDYAVKFLKPKRETYKKLEEQNLLFLQTNKDLSAEIEALRKKINEMNNVINHLTCSNREYEVKYDKHIAEIALLMQERGNLKSELSPIRIELSELQLSLEQEKAKLLSAEKMWNEEKYALTAEISELNLALQSANKQISDLTEKSEERNAKNNGFMGLFGR